MSRERPIKAASPAISVAAKKWLMLMLVIVSAPHMMYVPLWLAVAGCCVVFWVCLSITHDRTGIPSWGKGLLVVAVIIGVFVFASASQDLGGLSALLIAGAMLKSLELKTLRDGWVLILVACFIVAVGFLFSQSMLAAAYGVVSLIAIFCTLLMMHQVSNKEWFLPPVKKSLLILFQSLPLMLILFLIFPRVAPLWSVQYHNPAAKTGLSDFMEPGNISQLTRSDSVAFRVSFADNQPPPSADRYWRAMTYTDFDGQRWSISSMETESNINSFPKDGLVEYQVIAEPSGYPWLFALDYPLGSPTSGVQRFNDGTFKAASPILERMSYQAVSALSTFDNQTPLSDRFRYLAVPASGNPETRKMVSQWKEQGLSSEEIITVLFQSFNQHFTYTLSPQKLTNNRIDQFLFSTQEGFCEHFANATAYALRLAGIPTRVVGGYLGGEWNPYEKYLLVRQYEAHAWVEAWLDGKGWIRLDPTAAVSPERVIQPFYQLFAFSPEFMIDSPLAVFQLQQNLAWMKMLSLKYDALNYSWHRWILGYHQEQGDLLQDWLGRISFLKILLLLFLPVGGVLAIIIWRLLKAQARWVDRMDQEVEAISITLGKLSSELQRAAGETVSNYCIRLGGALPDVEQELISWYALYQRIRYAPPDDRFEHNREIYLGQSRQLLNRIKRLKKQNIIRKNIE